MRSPPSRAMARSRVAGLRQSGYCAAILGAATATTRFRRRIFPRPIRDEERPKSVDDKRNLIAALLLSVAILLGWNFVSEKFFPTPDTYDVTTTVADRAAHAATPETQGRSEEHTSALESLMRNLSAVLRLKKKTNLTSSIQMPTTN